MQARKLYFPISKCQLVRQQKSVIKRAKPTGLTPPYFTNGIRDEKLSLKKHLFCLNDLIELKIKSQIEH